MTRITGITVASGVLALAICIVVLIVRRNRKRISRLEHAVTELAVELDRRNTAVEILHDAGLEPPPARKRPDHLKLLGGGLGATGFGTTILTTIRHHPRAVAVVVVAVVLAVLVALPFALGASPPVQLAEPPFRESVTVAPPPLPERSQPTSTRTATRTIQPPKSRSPTPGPRPHRTLEPAPTPLPQPTDMSPAPAPTMSPGPAPTTLPPTSPPTTPPAPDPTVPPPGPQTIPPNPDPDQLCAVNVNVATSVLLLCDQAAELT